eukprot:1472935-Amphidinium_carterae.1
MLQVCVACAKTSPPHPDQAHLPGGRTYLVQPWLPNLRGVVLCHAQIGGVIQCSKANYVTLPTRGTCYLEHSLTPKQAMRLFIFDSHTHEACLHERDEELRSSSRQLELLFPNAMECGQSI